MVIERESLFSLMVVIAVATPALVALILVATRMDILQPLRRSRLILLAAAGPTNLVCWLLFNGYLDRVGHRSVIGIVLAAAVFIGLGFGAGFLRGRKEIKGGGPGDLDPPGEQPAE